jgi:D-threo-aldose 1-dehydrogenase
MSDAAAGATMSATDRHRVGGTKVHVSRLGVGGGSLFSTMGDDGVRRVVDICWDAGLRHFDTAPFYDRGASETRFGFALEGRPRDLLMVSTKVGRYAGPDGDVFDYSAEGTERSIATSLQRLKLDHLDIVFIHDITPEFHGAAFDERLEEVLAGAAPTLIRMREEGIIRAIGVAVADWEVALRFVRMGFLDCVMLAGGYTLLQHGSAAEFLPECDRRDVSVLVSAPFNTGILATGAVAGARYFYAPAPPEILARTRFLEEVCARHGVPLAAAALQFPLAHRAVTSVVVGHQSEAEVARNIGLIAHPIPPAFWLELRGRDLIPSTARDE